MERRPASLQLLRSAVLVSGIHPIWDQSEEKVRKRGVKEVARRGGGVHDLGFSEAFILKSWESELAFQMGYICCIFLRQELVLSRLTSNSLCSGGDLVRPSVLPPPPGYQDHRI